MLSSASRPLPPDPAGDPVGFSLHSMVSAVQDEQSDVSCSLGMLAPSVKSSKVSEWLGQVGAFNAVVEVSLGPSLLASLDEPVAKTSLLVPSKRLTAHALSHGSSVRYWDVLSSHLPSSQAVLMPSLLRFMPTARVLDVSSKVAASLEDGGMFVTAVRAGVGRGYCSWRGTAQVYEQFYSRPKIYKLLQEAGFSAVTSSRAGSFLLVSAFK